MKGQTEQYKWKVFAAFNNERKYWAKQIIGLIDWLILKKKIQKNNTNKRCNELLKMKGQIEQYEWKVSWAFKKWKDC